MNDFLNRLPSGESFTPAEMAAAIGEIMRGQWQADDIAKLLTGLHHKGETASEIAGAAQAMREAMVPIQTTRRPLIDTCGTGGDHSGTFNISTAAALATAACGLAVAKHGNRSITSKSGSADVLAQLGVNLEATVEQVQTCIDEIGIGFCFAPALHPAMRHVAPVRRELGFPTIFNMLGPICNPAGAPFQLIGVAKPEIQDKLAEAVLQLGTTRTVLVSGLDGMDEVSPSTATRVLVVTDSVEAIQWRPEDFGYSGIDKAALKVDGPQASAAVIRSVLAGELGPARQVVVMNAAAALWTVSPDSSLIQCRERVEVAIDQGQAQKVLKQLVKATS